MRLPPTERDPLPLFGAAELARARRARGRRLHVPEATALIADAVCEAARDGRRLAEAIEAARAVLGPDDVLPGVADVVTEGPCRGRLRRRLTARGRLRPDRRRRPRRRGAGRAAARPRAPRVRARGHPPRTEHGDRPRERHLAPLNRLYFL